MKNLFNIFAILFMSLSIVSCEDQIDYTEPEQEDVNNPDSNVNVTLALLESGSVDVNFNLEEEYSYDLYITKSHDIKSASATIEAVEPEITIDGMALLDKSYYTINSSTIDFAEEDVNKKITITFTNLQSLDRTTQFLVDFKLASEDLDVVEANSVLSFKLIPKNNLGTAENPYKIASAEDLNHKSIEAKLKDNSVVYFKLTQDVDLGNVDWQPIITSETKKINLDGNNFTIKNLICENSPVAFAGLFSSLYGEVRNLNIENASIKAVSKLCGVLAGSAHGAIIENVHTSGVVVLTRTAVDATVWATDIAGGICGKLLAAGKMNKCSSSASVDAYLCAGGLVGEVGGASVISESFSTGAIKANCVSGGIAGNGFNVTIKDCYHIDGVVDCDAAIKNPNNANAWLIEGRAGGIVGRIDNSLTVTNCYNTGDIVAYRHAGGIAGAGLANKNNNIIKGCIAMNETISATNTVGVLASGRINGHVQKVVNTTGSNCYALNTMSVLINGVTRNPAPVDQEKLTDVRFYDGVGIEKGEFISTAQTTLGWDSEIWDFETNSDRPTFKWENVQE